MTTQESSLPRIPIFNYHTIFVSLIRETKTLEIKFTKSHFNQEMVFELESILAWTSTHQEIQSIFITTNHSHFIQGIDTEEIKKFSEEKCRKFLLKISILAESLTCLPQTTIIDLKNGASGAGLEFALAADIRIATKSAEFSFNYLSQGLVPSAGLFSFLKPYLNLNILKSLLLSEKKFNNNELLALGSTIELNQSIDELLKIIVNQSPVARIQTKLGLQDNQKDIQEKILTSVLFTGDYKQDHSFMQTSSYKENIKNLKGL